MPAAIPHLAILMPLRDDWESAAQLAREIAERLRGSDVSIEIVIVDDGSRMRASAETFPDIAGIAKITAVRLRRNVGHQRAIAIGLVHIEQEVRCDAVLVMDSDGQDTAAGVIALLEAFRREGGSKAIFAARTRRFESILFRAFYQLFRGLHWSLTGISVRVGNFSIVPRSYLRTMVVLSELWNHYAAAVFRSKLDYTTEPIARGLRTEGESKMNFVGLVMHGLSAVSVFGDVVGVRLMVGSVAAALLVMMSLSTVAGVQLWRCGNIPEWTPFLVGTIAVVMFQMIAIATSFTFFILSSRVNACFLPLRDAPIFIDEVVSYPA